MVKKKKFDGLSMKLFSMCDAKINKKHLANIRLRRFF